jgi:Septum formation initiator
MKARKKRKEAGLWQTVKMTVHNLFKNFSNSFKTQKEDFFHSVNKAKISTKLIAGAVIGVFVVIGVLSLAHSYSSISEMERIYEENNKKIQRQTEINKQLEDEMTDNLDQYIENKAREKLEMVYPGEQIFINTAG